MNEITATELELLACFGVEPRLLDDDVPWHYNTATYATEVDGLFVSFIIVPEYRDVRIVVRRGDQRLFELYSQGVANVLVIDEPGIDAVEVNVAEGSWLRMQLRPSFEISGEVVDKTHRGSLGRHVL